MTAATASLAGGTYHLSMIMERGGEYDLGGRTGGSIRFDWENPRGFK